MNNPAYSFAQIGTYAQECTGIYIFENNSPPRARERKIWLWKKIESEEERGKSREREITISWGLINVPMLVPTPIITIFSKARRNREGMGMTIGEGSMRVCLHRLHLDPQGPNRRQEGVPYGVSGVEAWTNNFK